jgi:signal transduction histidine kinase
LPSTLTRSKRRSLSKYVHSSLTRLRLLEWLAARLHSTPIRERRSSFVVSAPRSRALTNIIGNALRYGHVAHVSTCQTNDAVQIIVDDEGSGIPRSQRKSIFRAFQRGESSRNRSTGGTGLGLAIALGIIERQHHGSIEIGDAPSGGARVTIRLPCWQS